jgi:chromate reductase
MTAPLNIVAICGSLRSDSYNRGLLRAMMERSPESMRWTELDWSALPVFSGDLEHPAPPEIVVRLQQQVGAADGVVIVTPEYNHGIPGGLKNLLDWLSRGGGPPHALFGIPAAIAGASDGMIGTARCQLALRNTLATLNVPTMPWPGVLVSNCEQRFDESRTLTHEPTSKFLATWLVDVEKWMRRFPRES